MTRLNQAAPALLLAVCVAACGRSAGSAAALPSPHPSPPAVAAWSSPAPSDRHLPGSLLIPAIGVAAPVDPVGVDARGDMDVPGATGHVGWYEPGPAPGEPGDAVMDGHLDWSTGPAVFQHLGKLTGGAEVDVVAQDGAVRRFLVTDVRTVAYSDHPPGLFSPLGGPRLSLVTCGGAWDSSRGTYLERLIVDAEPLAT